MRRTNRLLSHCGSKFKDVFLSGNPSGRLDSGWAIVCSRPTAIWVDTLASGGPEVHGRGEERHCQTLAKYAVGGE